MPPAPALDMTSGIRPTELTPPLPPAIAAGRPLMKTSREPSTTGAPLWVPSPTRAAGLPPIIVSGLPWVMGLED